MHAKNATVRVTSGQTLVCTIRTYEKGSDCLVFLYPKFTCHCTIVISPCRICLRDVLQKSSYLWDTHTHTLSHIQPLVSSVCCVFIHSSKRQCTVTTGVLNVSNSSHTPQRSDTRTHARAHTEQQHISAALRSNFTNLIWVSLAQGELKRGRAVKNNRSESILHTRPQH